MKTKCGMTEAIIEHPFIVELTSYEKCEQYLRHEVLNIGTVLSLSPNTYSYYYYCFYTQGHPRSTRTTKRVSEQAWAGIQSMRTKEDNV